MSAAIDSIIVGNTARKWFEANKLLPSDWNLDETEQNRIESSGIRLTAFSSPAGILMLRDNPFKSQDHIRLIVLDITVLKKGLSREELIAIILHEVGHVLRPPPSHHATPLSVDDTMQGYLGGMDKLSGDKPTADELLADDYVVTCKFDKHLISALEKLKSDDPAHFIPALTAQRIERIKKK